MRRTLLALAVAAGAVVAAPRSVGIARDPDRSQAPSGFVAPDRQQVVSAASRDGVGLPRGEGRDSGRDVLTVTHRHDHHSASAQPSSRDRLTCAGASPSEQRTGTRRTRRGNVWYLGERTAELDARGRTISTEGSWRGRRRWGPRRDLHAGTPDARRKRATGVLQGACRGPVQDPQPAAHVSTPAASSRHALLTEETTRLEPGGGRPQALRRRHRHGRRAVGQGWQREVCAGDPASAGRRSPSSILCLRQARGVPEDVGVDADHSECGGALRVL